MNYQKLYDLKQDCEESAAHFFDHGNGHHVRVDVRYFTGAFFSVHCENAAGLNTLFHTLLQMYRTEYAEFHPTDVKVAWVYADDN